MPGVQANMIAVDTPHAGDRIMDLLRLRYFLMVLDEGSMSRAAIKLGVTQPGLSRQIQALEREFKTPLLYRTGRGVAGTPAGIKFADGVRPLVEKYDAVKAEIQEESSRPQGTVIFGITPSLGSTIAASVALSFRQKHPKASLKVREAFSTTLLEWVEHGRLDIAVFCDARRTFGDSVTPLLLEDLYLVQSAKPKKPVDIRSPADLEKLGFVLPTQGSSLRHVIDIAARTAGVELTVGLELDSMPAIKQIVEQGIWSTIVTYAAVHAEVAAGRLTAMPMPIKMQALQVTATARHRAVSKTTTALRRILVAEVERCVSAGILRGTVYS
jgi:LysR family nitrogen assimilation transcriptional regulator